MSWQLIYLHPISWLAISLVFTFIFYLLKKKKRFTLSLIISVVLLVSLIPRVSQYWLESIWDVLNVQGFACDESITSDVHAAVMLPAGLIKMNDSYWLTEWSVSRVESLVAKLDQGLISKVIVPGGYLIDNTLEGVRIKGFIPNKHKKRIPIVVGDGSSSTLGNFKEISSMLDMDALYVVYTSKWHGFRAISVAKKMGLNVCLAQVENKFESKPWYLSAWRLKTAIREYIAIIWYSLTGRI